MYVLHLRVVMQVISAGDLCCSLVQLITGQITAWAMNTLLHKQAGLAGQDLCYIHQANVLQNAKIHLLVHLFFKEAC